MKRLTLIAMKQDEEKLMHALQDIEAVQIIASGEECADSAALDAAESRVQRLKSAFSVLRPYAEKSKLGPKPECTAAELAALLPSSITLCEHIEELERSLTAVRADMDKHRALIAALTPWQELSSSIEDIHSTRTVRYFTGMLDADAVDMLSDINAAIEVFGDGRERALLIACRTDDAENIQAALKSVSFNEFSFPKLTGTPAANIASLTAELAEFADKEQSLITSITQYATHRNEIARALDASVIERDRENGKCALGATATAFVLDGWIRSDEEDTVRNAIRSITGDCYIELRDPADDEIPPSVVKNNRLITPFESVTNLYSKPDPRGIDGTPLMAPFYFVFFGMMLSDTGYGLVLLLGCLAFLKFMKPSGMMRGIAEVLFLGGISTVVCGFFIGTFFGMDWNTVFGTPSGTFPLLFDPMIEPMSMLYLCFGLGLAHMLFGVSIKVYRCIKARDWAAAIFDNVSWLMIVIGILIFASPSLISGIPAVVSKIGLIMAIAGAALILIFAGRGKKLASRALSGAGKLYDITGYLSDMLSYARVFALGLSTGVIGQVLNTLGSMFNNAFQNGLLMQGIGFLLTAALLVALHLFSLGINVLGCFVHCARLQYVEFYGRFYDAGGKNFTPLGYSTRNVRIKAQ
ncbi:MAG: V-type ATP synthase subunit I [Clostridia bacterium]